MTFHFPDSKKCGDGWRYQVIRHNTTGFIEPVVVNDFISTVAIAEYMASSLNRDRHILGGRSK